MCDFIVARGHFQHHIAFCPLDCIGNCLLCLAIANQAPDWHFKFTHFRKWDVKVVLQLG